MKAIVFTWTDAVDREIHIDSEGLLGRESTLCGIEMRPNGWKVTDQKITCQFCKEIVNLCKKVPDENLA